jgi:hypothetical protein
VQRFFFLSSNKKTKGLLTAKLVPQLTAPIEPGLTIDVALFLLMICSFDLLFSASKMRCASKRSSS